MGYLKYNIKQKPKVIVSSCLLGEQVRYDGHHKQNDFLLSQLSPLLELASNCPEVGCGMPIPRPPIQVCDQNAQLILREVASPQNEHTESMLNFCQVSKERVESTCGIISKSKSPSCGITDTPIFVDGAEAYKASGLFIHTMKQQAPWLPMIDEQALQQDEPRHFFLTQVFLLAHFYEASSTQSLKAFHHSFWPFVTLFAMDDSSINEAILDDARLYRDEFFGRLQQLASIETLRARWQKWVEHQSLPREAADLTALCSSAHQFWLRLSYLYVDSSSKYSLPFNLYPLTSSSGHSL
ncbi:DUF523 domain-containing protein [Pleionea sp. CnH1-48]|uniref:DUF523 domain-containing protein n=1 Tax=Pleionea sp. CnH1-48 TaxID=2954494 RepID=UPI002096BF4C|nr:DUF523 domain-containing protein [Pleionea sp. CnH1-48]MCO7227164.1 DUF523 domain-containing protein [Pleionea sp. CnH1-48]